MSIEDQIQERIEAFAAEITALIKTAALDAVREALAPQVRTNGQRTTSSKRTPEQMAGDKERLAAYVTDNPGSSMETIAAALNSTSKNLHRPMAQLLKSKDLRRRGQRRASRYFPKAKSG